MKFPLCLWLLSTAACITVCASAPGSSSSDDWRAIDPAELASKTPIVDKNADAEAIFWEVRVDDGNPGELVFSNYVRVKVYTDRGKESQSQIDLEYYAGSKIKDISARTIKPDGAIIEVTKDDVHDRTIVKGSGVKLKAKSFAMPAVEPGAIVEYRWKEVRNDRLANYIRLQFEREIPVQLVKYYIKPLSLPDFPYGMRVRSFQFDSQAFNKETDG